MRVLKFGGSSLANADRIRDVNDIILAAVKEEPVIVVVSAFHGVSNKLVQCAQMAASGDASYQNLYKELVHHHHEVIKQLIPARNEAILKACDELLHELNEILQGIYLLKELTLGALDHIASFGERLSANVIAAYIKQNYPAQFVDARQFIFTDNQHTAANVLFSQTNAAIRSYYEKHFSNQPVIPVVTGFIGSTVDQRVTTLGRNSSDYSATIVGGALNASRVEIWTDVDGVYSADPNLVPGAFILSSLSYLEAIELSYFGGKVVHALTFEPVMEKEIPILIKNSLNPESSGTYIVPQSKNIHTKKWAAKSVTAVDDITLLIWVNKGIPDASHVIERLFRSLTLANVQTFLHIEGSPGHTVYIAVKNSDIEKTYSALRHEFHLEFKHHLVAVEEKTSQCIVAIIGEDMTKLPPETAGKMFQYLGRMGIQINAIVHGASQRSLCLVIDNAQRTRALNLIHEAFFAKYKKLAVFIMGVGRVGTALLRQLLQQQQVLLKKKIELTVCAISNSKKMLTSLKGLNLAKCKTELLRSNEPFEISSFLKMIPQINSNIALIDSTASRDIVETYPLFIQEGVHIITPNKQANVLPFHQYTALMEQFKSHRSTFLCRTNVGAGLPVLTILKDLLDCGDTIIKIEGIFSGTLSYVFNHYNDSVSFASVLQQAHQLELTEPDPREDLSGVDVGRKLLIMARYMGWKMELDDIPIENLVPKVLRSGPFTDQFFEDLKNNEDFLKSKLELGKQENKVLRYIGSIHAQEHKASARLEFIAPDHPLARATYSDNIVVFTTHHYRDSPLVISGPGAGVDCTALGVFSDILELISTLPD